MLEQTFETPEENVAADEALLDWCEATGHSTDLVRVWEPPRPMVVLGRASRAAAEVNLPACRAEQVPVLRRSSGGATIVSGPGCLMYAVVINIELQPELRLIDRVHRHVLDRLVEALSDLVPTLTRSGTSDLSFVEEKPSRPEMGEPAERRKCSGNSVRIKRTHLVYHGTLLYAFDVSMMGSLLRHPPREPDYRRQRRHTDFVANLPVDVETLKSRVATALDGTPRILQWPEPERVRRLTETRYASDDWTFGIGSRD